jgi:hypothetical protein
MRFLSLALLLLQLNSALASSLDEVRSLFFRIEENKENVVRLQQLTQNGAELGSSVLIGYHAVATANLAQHTVIPISKYNYFRQGRDKIEQVISSFPDNAELRFLRITIQIGTPGFLNYNQNIVSDRDFVLNYLEKKSPSAVNDNWFWVQVLLYLRDRSKPDNSSLARINTLIKNLGNH